MSLALTKSRGSFLNWRFEVNGIQNARMSFGVVFRRLDIDCAPEFQLFGRPERVRGTALLMDGSACDLRTLATRQIRSRRAKEFHKRSPELILPENWRWCRQFD